MKAITKNELESLIDRSNVLIGGDEVDGIVRVKLSDLTFSCQVLVDLMDEREVTQFPE